MRTAIVGVLVLVACGSDPGDDEPDAVAEPRCDVVAGAPADVVMTTGGPLRGAADGATLAFRGVPYASPPVGDLRYRAPVAVACGETEIDATALRAKCPQLEDDVFIGDEDCLHLNVWAPANAGPRPVMVWIHGGGNVQGSAADPIYDGRRLAEAGDVVVVTINYRLGQLGFLGLASLPEPNAGILDQIAALGWVRDNIAAFGGDPANVTIFGESAGGRDTCTLLATPATAGLFHRAIVQSGACKFLPARADAETAANDYATDAGCTGSGDDIVACLRALSPETAIRTHHAEVSALSSAAWQPFIDGVVIPGQPEHVIAAGQHHAVPFAIGANADETASSVPAIATEQAYEAAVRAQLPPALADMALAQYPASAYPTPRAAYVRLTTDLRFVCPSREIAEVVDGAQAEPVFRYFFQYDDPSPFGAVHGLDVPFVFGTFSAIIAGGNPYQPTATDLAVSADMQRLWTEFARTGTATGWPTYDAATDPSLVVDAPLSTATGIRAADCDFWEPFYDAL